MQNNEDPLKSIAIFGDAVTSNNRGTIQVLISDLVSFLYCHHTSYDEEKASKILTILRRRRLFDEMRQAAEAFINNGCASFRIRKLYAQALIDLGYLAAAEDVLNRLKAETHAVSTDSSKAVEERLDASKEWAEACGLLGRNFKDRYVNANAPDVERNQLALNKAISHYYACYISDKKLRKTRHWHGINAVALARLAGRQGVPVTMHFDVLDVAQTILDEIKEDEWLQQDIVDIWAAATAMEASIALNNWQDTYTWAQKYANRKQQYVDAFEIAGTLRQLQDVWQLSIDKEPGSVLIPLLRSRLQELEGFHLSIPHTEPVDTNFLSAQLDGLERVFGGGFLSFRLYRDGISRASAIARIGPSAEEHGGTGFMIDGKDLHPELAGDKLLLTCHHVVNETSYTYAVRPHRAVVTFRENGKRPQEFRVRSLLWTSPIGKLDVSILRLEGDTGNIPTIPWAELRPLGEKRVLIFGYAVGGALAFSLGDNQLVDQNEIFLQYRAPTVGGSSGSPVFNTEFELVAVHHLGRLSLPKLNGDGTHEANQGTSIFAVREAVEEDPQELFG